MQTIWKAVLTLLMVYRVRFSPAGVHGPDQPPTRERTLLKTLSAGVIIFLLVGSGVAADAIKRNAWPTYAGGPQRLFFHPTEKIITADNVDQLQVKWTFLTGAVVTASPSIARLDVPDDGRIPIVFLQSWDGFLYALRLYEGTELWRFHTTLQPGATYPNAGSVDVREIDGQPRVFFAAGETVYALDALTGEEIWHFDAGTGCLDPPGLCGLQGERNQVESSPIVADGKVFFGMDVNDQEGGKGGFYAVNAHDGRLVWYFDVATGSTCQPLPDDEIRRFDGYHSEEELGLPAGFLASRPGCDFDRTPIGCGNVWSSAAIDEQRALLFFASSNCDTDEDPATLTPPPPMPPFDEAIVALHFDGTPAWRWRPREVDNENLAFGAVPNLFEIKISGKKRDVVGVGNKDGTYYVLDREGVNALTGVRWDDPNPAALPYWATNVVPGGDPGGIIATAAVDPKAGRIYFSTAPGSFNPFNPQRPTVHALEKDTGAILWQNTLEENADASFAPTSALPEVMFVGSIIEGALRAYDATTGDKLASVPLGFAVASAPAIVDGIVVVGAGVGDRGNPGSPEDLASRVPQNITALCIPGTRHCQ
jgi:polyvinyl alcohol dehydrogenase (cytochrome)